MTVTRTVQGNVDLCLLDGARASRVTFDAAVDSWSVWSPDGTRIAFNSNRAGPADLYQKLTNGADVEEWLAKSDENDSRESPFDPGGPRRSSDPHAACACTMRCKGRRTQSRRHQAEHAAIKAMTRATRPSWGLTSAPK